MLRSGQILILSTLALLGVGVVMVNSAGLTIGSQQQLTMNEMLTGRAACFALLALAALAIGTTLPIGRLVRLHWWPIPVLAVVIVLLLLVHVPGIGREVNGARRWISIGPIGFQPSEIAKWACPLVIAAHAARRPELMGRFGTGFIGPMVVVGLICALIASEDLGTAVLIAAISVFMLLAGGARLWHGLLLLPVAITGFVAAVLQSPYRLQRLQSFMDPYGDPQGTGYHMIQSMAAVAGGGLAGRGVGNSIQKFGYLPEDTTDFIFAIICEEMGLMGAILVIFLYGALCLAGLAVVRRTEQPFLRLLGLGIVLTIGFQALINLAVVTGCAPTKGIALPLISAGGTGWVLTAGSIGLLVAMDSWRPSPNLPLTDAVGA